MTSIEVAVLIVSKNIKARKAKGFGIADSIMSILENTFFGPFFFEASLILRSSLLINSIILNSEVWYGVSKAEVEELEVVDQALLKRILEAPSTTPTPMLYLEMGCLPIRYIIMTRRIMYLHYLLTQDDDSLLSSFFMAQWENPVPGDWTEQVKIDLEKIKLDLTLETIKLMSKEEFQKVVKNAINKTAFAYLNVEKQKRDKVKHIEHRYLKLQPYLCPGNLNIREAKLLFHLRTRMVDVKENFRNKYPDTICPVCKGDLKDTQEHVLVCSVLNHDRNMIVKSPVVFSWIFGTDVVKQSEVTRLFQYLWNLRTKFLEN